MHNKGLSWLDLIDPLDLLKVPEHTSACNYRKTTIHEIYLGDVFSPAFHLAAAPQLVCLLVG